MIVANPEPETLACNAALVPLPEEVTTREEGETDQVAVLPLIRLFNVNVLLELLQSGAFVLALT